MVLHSDDQDWATSLVHPTESVFARGVYFVDNFLGLTDFVRPVAFVPLHPSSPHFVYFILLEFPCYAESSDGVNVGIEISPLLEMREFLIKNFYYLFLLGLDLRQFTIGDPQGIGALHIRFIIRNYL